MRLEINTPRSDIHNTSHDRLTVLWVAQRTLIAAADGASAGLGSQTAAARIVDELARSFRSGVFPDDSRDWEMILEGIDQVICRERDAGEASALVMMVQYDIVVGASVGDTLAYVIPPLADPQLLTIDHPSGSKIGSGMARPKGFGPMTLDGKLITRRAAWIDASWRACGSGVA